MSQTSPARRFQGARSPAIGRQTRRNWDCHHVLADSPHQVLTHLVERDAAEVEWITFHQYHIGSLDGDIHTRTDRDATIGLGKRGCVVNAVTHHRHLFVLRLQVIDLVGFLAGLHFGKRRLNAQFIGNTLSRRFVISGPQATSMPNFCKAVIAFFAPTRT